MSIQVKFFASLREKIGLANVNVETAKTAGEAWTIATNNAELPANLLVAINLNYAQLNTAVFDGDEIAFFPPVTGG